MYLITSTSTFHHESTYKVQVHSFLGKCTKVHSEYFQNVLEYNQEYISITEQFLYPDNKHT